MIEFGNTLRAAREAKGCTVAQIAESTHLAPSVIEDLEREDFSRIPAPIYGRGFVKLYCEAVGLDPKPLVAEFMDIFNGNHDTAIRERPAKNPPTPAPMPAAEQAPAAPAQGDLEPPQRAVPSEPAVPTSQDLFAAEPPPAADATTMLETPPPVAAPRPASITAPEPPPRGDLFAAPEPPPANDLFAAAAEPQPREPRLSRYAAPVSQSQYKEPSTGFLSPSLWRIAVLASVAIVLLWLGILGLRSLYRATSPAVEPTERDDAVAGESSEPAVTKPASQSAAPKPEAAAPAKTAAAPRTPQSIPALYID